MKLWIDENLTPRLVEPAHDRGYEATASRDRGKLRLLDEKLYSQIADGDWVLVTNNDVDFTGLLGAAELHPGMIVMPQRLRTEQIAMFDGVLQYIEDQAAADGEVPTNWMLNRVVEVDEETEECSHYWLPGLPDGS